MKKITLFLILIFVLPKINFAQKIYSFPEAEKDTIMLEKLLSPFQSIQTHSVPEKPDKFIFGNSFEEQKKYHRKIYIDFFSGLKQFLDEKKFTKKRFELDYTLYFDEKGKLIYIIYSLEPVKTKYKLSKAEKLEFFDYLTIYSKDYQSNVSASEKYKLNASFIQK